MLFTGIREEGPEGGGAVLEGRGLHPAPLIGTFEPSRNDQLPWTETDRARANGGVDAARLRGGGRTGDEDCSGRDRDSQSAPLSGWDGDGNGGDVIPGINDRVEVAFASPSVDPPVSKAEEEEEERKPGSGAVQNGQGRLRSRVRLLSCPEDGSKLSEDLCIARAQIEVFIATADDVKERLRNGGVRDSVDVGRVGIRCVHCAAQSEAAARCVESSALPPSGGSEKTIKFGMGAVSYPKELRLVYQAVRNWKRHHLMKCPYMPEDVKTRFLELKKALMKQKSSPDSAAYWQNCLKRMGAVDTDMGVRTRRGVFEDGDGVAACAGNDGEPPSADRGRKQTLTAAVTMAECSAKAPGEQALTAAITATECSTNTYEERALTVAANTKECSTKAPKESTAGTCQPATASSGAIYTESFDLGPVTVGQSAPMHSLIPPRKMVLRQVELAFQAVQAMTEIQQLPASDRCNEGERQQELLFLGLELYELFSGSHPFDDGNTEELALSAQDVDCILDTLGSSNEPSSGNQLKDDSPGSDSPVSSAEGTYKRKKQRDTGRHRKYVPLSELGLPLSLCTLVSSLLDAHGTTSNNLDAYDSITEVQEDLRLMLSRPDRFLFDRNGPKVGDVQQLAFSPTSLYGRDGQVSTLLEAYQQMISSASTAVGTNKVDSRSSMVLISGYSGTGKSSLVRKVQSEYVRRGARFISGKFDYMQQIQPLSAIMHALNEYCDLLAHDTSRVDQIRTAVMAAIGSEGQVLANLIPNLRKVVPDIVGGPPSADVTGMEAQHRFEFLVQMLLRSTCSGENPVPVVLFLDDLQWADASSLELMRSLVTDTLLDKLLVIGCYRDNEVGHLLLKSLDSIQRSGHTAISRISTNNLDLASVTALVSDALHMLPRATRSLSEAVLQKTSGNALFVEQFLASLNDEGLLRYSLVTRKWEWDIESIRAKNIANNVVDLMTTKLLRLAPEVHEALKVAAAFGSQCLKDVLRIFDKDPGRMGSTVAALDVAVAEGVMAEVEGTAYRFSHDQLQNAAYMLIVESEREAFHLGIGRSLWQQASEEEVGNYIFILVDQLHRGVGQIPDHTETIRLAHLSLTAGQKAVALSAFLPASVYLKTGIGLLQETDWELHRELCFDLHNLCAETKYTLGEFQEVRVHLDETMRRGRTLREQLRPYYISVRSSGSADAFTTAITVLGYLGESIPSEVTQLQVQQELLATHVVLSTKAEGALSQMQTMTDVDKREAMRFCNILLFYAYADRPEYFPLLACRMLKLSLLYGVCKESAIAFASYGMCRCGMMGDTAGGYRLGKVALSLLERFNATECLPRVFLAVYGFTNDWTDPLQSSLPCLKRAIGVGLSIGAPQIAMLNAQCYQGGALASGMPLGPLMAEMNQYANQMLELNQHLVYTMNKPVRQFTLNLLGHGGTVMDEDALLSLAEEKGSSTLSSVVYFYRMWLEVLFGEYERAAETAAKNKDVYKSNMGRFGILCNHVFLYGLTALVLARQQGRGKWESTINATLTKMRKWTLSAPWNCEHKLGLLIAEYAYLEGDIATAAQAYESAVATAQRHRFIHDEALALERAGIFYMERGDHATATGLFERAHGCYIKWEAHSKAAHVKRYL